MTPQELKASILQLAIQGKLVPQIPEEGTSEELFQQIQAEKQALIKAGKIKKEKSLPEITEDEIPFDIPESWEWVRIAQIVTLNPKNDIDDDLEVAFIPMPCVQDGFRNRHTFEIKNWKDIKKGFTHFAEGDIGVAKITPCFQNRKSVIFRDLANGYGAGTTELTVVRTIGETVLPEYLLWFFKSEHFIANGVKSFTGTAGQQRIHKDYLATCPIPLPPLAEQKRIVAKIEELLPLIDRYEQAWSKLEDFNKRFPVDMQKSILQMAIQGKLVEQRDEEGTALNLKKELKKKKAEWVESGKILRKAETPQFLDSDDLFDIPESWEWVQLSDVSIIQEGAGIRKWQYRDAGTQILCVTNILEGSIDLEKKQLYISTEEYLEKYQHLTLEKGDIVTSCSGGSWGKISFFDCEDTLMLNTSTLRMRFFGDLADNNYLYYVCKSSFFKRQLELQLSGMQPNFGYAHYSRILLPLPPLAEQKRIVAKLEEILPLCERLK